MYYFQFMGGLGNQLFQYAAARALNLKTKVPFKVYFEDKNYYAPRSYQLDQFQIEVQKANEEEIPKNTIWAKTKRKLNIANPIFKEKIGFTYDPTFFEQKLNTHYYGYWQNEAYFKDYRSVLLSELQLKKAAIGDNLACLKNIAEVNSVAIHVRRGDYIVNPEANATHGLCGIEYYQKAIAFFEENHKANHYFIFSDDAAWVKKNLHFITHQTIVDWNLEQPEQDLRLMSNCKHQIIANSSFSWWGAWLNQYNDKIVVAPKQWTTQHSNCSILPKEWLQM